MAYTPPSNFVINSKIDAQPLEDNFDAARDYINNQIQGGDVSTATLDTTDIMEGEFFAVTDDYNFPVYGDMYSDYKAYKGTGEVYERNYSDCTIKPNEPTKSTRYVSLLGKEVFLEQTGHVLVTFSGLTTLHILGKSSIKSNHHEYLILIYTLLNCITNQKVSKECLSDIL